MAMNAAYLNAIRDHGQSLITHIGLVDDTGTELSGGGYARQAVTWTDSADGVSRPSANLVFTTEAGDVVAGWRGFSASTSGTDYGGADLTEVTYSNAGTYTLLAASTSITHA
jgi:hypothetical protein